MCKRSKQSLEALALFLLIALQPAKAQTELESEALLPMVVRLTAALPLDIKEAHRRKETLTATVDSIDKVLTAAYPALAHKVQRSSARLNAMANINEPNAKLSLIPPNHKMADYFQSEWDKMDALERAYNKRVKTIEGLKALYKVKGYLPVWDSAYNSRRPALVAYRDGALKLVAAEISYLKANESMFRSKNVDERMQWVEAELSVLQKLVLLKGKLKKLVLDDGAEKVQFCIDSPGACLPAKQ